MFESRRRHEELKGLIRLTEISGDIMTLRVVGVGLTTPFVRVFAAGGCCCPVVIFFFFFFYT